MELGRDELSGIEAPKEDLMNMDPDKSLKRTSSSEPTCSAEGETGPATPATWRTRDYFAEMYVAGVLADAGWDVYFPRRDRGFDMIVSRQSSDATVIRPVQVKGKYASDEKTAKTSYGYVGRLTAFHDEMILAIPYFTGHTAAAPAMIAWMPRAEIRPHARGSRCEPARFGEKGPEPRPAFRHFFDEAGLARFLPVDGSHPS